MFTTRLGRVAHRASTASPATSTPLLNSAYTAATKPTHTRRHSSSKASIPPNNGKPAPDADAKTQDPASAEGAREQLVAPAARKGRRNSRASRHVSVAATQAKKTEFAHLPSVPDVQHLNGQDLVLSRFFAQHRPLSVTTTIPPPSTPDAFSKIFESRPARDPWADGNSAERRPEDVIYTIHNVVESLENATASARSDGVRYEVIQESQSNSGNITHLDGTAQPQFKSMEEMVSLFKPYRAPPPPQPFVEAPKSSGGSEKKSVVAKQAARRQRQKSYQTTITVTERTSASGEKSYTASHTPIIAIQEPSPSGDAVRKPVTPFLERMRRRQQVYLQGQRSKILAGVSEQQQQQMVRRAPGAARRVKMMLISVKRQRKLKMKKHKYKKLMKRTRNLRRRLDRN